MKRLNLVVGETPKGALKVLYFGKDRSKAKEVVKEAIEEGKLREVMHTRNLIGTRKFPLRMKQRVEQLENERWAEELPGKIEAVELSIKQLDEGLPALKTATEEATKGEDKKLVQETADALAKAETDLELAKHELKGLEEERVKLQKLGLLELPDLDPEEPKK